MKALEYVGRKFGGAFVLSEVDAYISPAGYRDRQFKCRCICGRVWVVRASSIRRGLQGCGCTPRPLIRHGHAKAGNNSRTYRVWAGMIRRCEAEAATNYARYGGRGINVCKRWRSSFEAFLSDMMEKPDGLTIERINNDGDYEPGNCRWATRQDQARNKSTNNIEANEHLIDAASRLGISHAAISQRLRRGWSRERAFTTPRWHKSKSGFANRGEGHPMAKLTVQDVAAIRAALASGRTGSSLAREYSVSMQTVSNIKHGKSWPV